MKLVILLLHIAVCVALILIVLIQKGKGAGMGVAFGGTSQTVFGSGGATSFLHKVTTIVAIVFMLTSLSLSFFYGKRSTSSIMEGVKQTEVPASENAKKPAQTSGAQGQQQ